MCVTTQDVSNSNVIYYLLLLQISAIASRAKMQSHHDEPMYITY